MGSVEEPSSSPSHTPEEIEKYKQDYDRSFTLFQNALQEYSKPEVEPHKQAKLKEVMDQALQVMNEIACVTLKKGKQAQAVQLEEGYKQFIKDPTAENHERLMQDVKKLQ